MRLKITLKSEDIIRIPFNYNHIISAIIYNKIKDIDYATRLHDSSSYKFFNFSKINIYKKRRTGKGFISKNGIINFFISSSDDYLIKELAEGFLKDKTVIFQNQLLSVDKVELFSNPSFNSKTRFYTLSPVIARKKRLINGEYKIWDLEANDEFFKSLETNLIKKYNEFYNYFKEDYDLHIYSEMNNVKRKRITIRNGSNKIYHRAYLMDLIIEGDADLINFAYDVGVGEKNSQGFGMLDIVK